MNLQKTIVQWFLKSNKNQSKEKDLKYQLLNKLKIQRLPIALAQVKAGNNSKKIIEWNHTNCLFIVSTKRSYQKGIQ